MFDTTFELLRQIRLGEDSSLGLKNLKYRGDQVNDPHRNSMADELAAMANTGNGVFVLGVDSKSRTVVGIPEDKLDVVETWIRGICNDLITPQLFYRIWKEPVVVDDGVEKTIIKVDVPRSLYVHQSPGGYFYRLGMTTQQMSPDILATFFQNRGYGRCVNIDRASFEEPIAEQDAHTWEHVERNRQIAEIKGNNYASN